MILFDGIDMNSVADVKIEDIRVSSIQYSPVTANRPIEAGAVFVRNRCGTRTVSVTFALLKMDRAARQSALMAVSAWAKTDKEYKLELPGHPDHYLMAVCTAKPDPSTRQWWESKLRIVFTCYTNPFWTDKIEKTATCGTAFTVLGDAEPIMRIERTLSADASNQAYSLDGNAIRFSTIPTGDFVLDINNETAVVGTTSIMSNLNVWSKWIVPRIGTQTITGTGTIKYRERWQ